MDQISRWLSHNGHTRFAVAVLDASIQRILSQHAYPEAISALLSELISCTVLMRSGHKQAGYLISQIQNEGGLRALVCKCNENYGISGLCQFEQDHLNEPLLSQGKIVLTLVNDQSEHPYQSVVPFHHEDICEQHLVLFSDH